MNIRTYSWFWVVATLGFFGAEALGFNGHKVTQGPINLTVEPFAPVTRMDTAQDVKITLANAGPAPLTVTLSVGGLADPWQVVGETQTRVDVPARGTATTATKIIVGKANPGKAYSALYPLHVTATFTDTDKKPVAAHAVLVYSAEFAALPSNTPDELAPVVVPEAGAVGLIGQKNARVSWQVFGKPLTIQAVGWTGSDKESGTSVARTTVSRGPARTALTIHPPYRQGAGTVFLEYRLQLPSAKPIRLAFMNMIRESGPGEPNSDGVTFRVWANERAVFERHTDSKTWLVGEADLSEFAGKEISLKLESHPGPKKNTVCDSSFWGDVVVFAGKPPRIAAAEERQKLVTAATQAAQSGKGEAMVFELAGGARAAIALGANGLFDGAIAFADQEKTVACESMGMSILDQPLGRWPSAAVIESVRTEKANGRVRIVHAVRMSEKRFTVTAEAAAKGPGLRIAFETDQRVTDLAPVVYGQKAKRLYFGHGYCVSDPGAFRMGGGGHGVAGRHVGMDFEGGLSLLVAADIPIDHFRVDPANRVYALHAHPQTAFTFVPSAAGAADCVLKYRPTCELKASSGYAKKAGRYVFDYWGGRYADDAALLRKAFDYGLTDSLVIMHVWQRWGYDYRLPDIYPPDPRHGTLEDLQNLGRACAEKGALFALHDNYIDFYPDADQFSYDHITFSTDGNPRRAWLNQGRDAQSYQFRPDHVMPFLKRNMELITPSLKPTASFVDVFTSANVFDYYDRSGAFHSRLETQKCWGEAMAYIRQRLGNDAPVISEAGSDQLIGWVDGADCQLIALGDKPKFHGNVVPCADWDIVPWFDAVYHDRFSQHGVGYSGRYQNSRSRALHGIDSDDYLSAEILTGHALMTDLASGLRNHVRKYWLAQPFVRSIATDSVASFSHVEGDIHRVNVSWNSGAKVRVNRGKADWAVDGHVLPTYGFVATNGPIQSSIERVGGAVVEQSRWPGGFYVNARGVDPEAPLPITPSVAKFEYVGGRQFKLPLLWDAKAPTPTALSHFLHLYKPQVSRLVKEGFVANGGRLPKPTTQWSGSITTGAEVTITLPDDCTPGRYDVLVGLFEPKAKGRRVRLLAEEDGDRRYRLGTLVVEGNKKGEVTGMRYEPIAEPDPLMSRLMLTQTPVDFGVAKTLGAFRCEIGKDKLTITPLPGGTPFDITLRLDKILGRAAKVRNVHIISPRGDTGPEFKQSGQELLLKTHPDVFGYEVELEQ